LNGRRLSKAAGRSDCGERRALWVTGLGFSSSTCRISQVSPACCSNIETPCISSHMRRCFERWICIILRIENDVNFSMSNQHIGDCWFQCRRWCSFTQYLILDQWCHFPDFFTTSILFREVARKRHFPFYWPISD
jgi:hypothetical protein